MADKVNHSREALEVLREGGWVQNAFTTFQGKHCIIGAVQESPHYVAGMLYKYLDPVRSVIAEQYPAWRKNGVSMMGWNDEPGRTWEEVERVLEKAALLEDEAL